MRWTPQKQQRILLTKENYCLRHQQATPTPADHCPVIWDRILCWPVTQADTLSIQQCPDYVYGLNPHGFAWKYCTKNGTWSTRPGTDQPWSNFTECLVENSTHTETRFIPEIIKNRIGEIQLTYRIGYGLSLASLIIAFIIMTSIKQLRCQRNMIHANLFVSYIIRAVLSFLKDTLLVSHLGFPSDVTVGEDGQIEFIEDGSHVACRVLFSLFNYTLQANFVWLLLEGVYLHIVIFFPRLCTKAKLVWFMLVGWCFPSVYVVVWAITRLHQDNTLCWNVNILSDLYWVLKAPIIFSIVINFLLFLNMVRVLYTKISALSISDSKKSRKLGRATLILIPLYGVYNVVFILIPENKLSDQGQFISLFIEMFFNSFQGFLIALLYCFLNHQVQNELSKLWQRYLLKRDLGPVTRSRTWSNLSHVTRPRIGSHSSNASEKVKCLPVSDKASRCSVVSETTNKYPVALKHDDNGQSSGLLHRILSTVDEWAESKQGSDSPVHTTGDRGTELDTQI